MHKIVQKVSDSSKVTPFRMTKEEKAMMAPDYQEPKRKVILNFVFRKSKHLLFSQRYSKICKQGIRVGEK